MYHRFIYNVMQPYYTVCVLYGVMGVLISYQGVSLSEVS